ncbi:MAG: DnaJ domain-containing protein [Fuerstiella sp.]|nr:DnaJ domain-containing protein [Fuerstiella sp.]MCP4858384.1 DnaJ domain-containing protein [Fuerstiella sp.]
MNVSIDDPFEILGVSQDASDEAIRARYLELIKEFPPELDPERFRQIQAAYTAAKDPLRIARGLLEPPDIDAPHEWSDVINAHEKRPPNLNVDFLLSLGNRAKDYRSESSEESAPLSNSGADATADETSQQAIVDPAAHE